MDGRRKFLLHFSIFSVIAVSAISLYSQGQNTQGSKKQLPIQADEEQWPITDYQAPEPNDPSEIAKRKIRGKKYEKGIVPIEPEAGGLLSTLNTHWEMDLPSLPVAQSNLIVIGTLSDAQAFLSPNKIGVYSEFRVNIEKVFKNDTTKILAPGEQITLERQGGRVRVPGGGIQRYVVAGQGFPRVGRRYLFFLSRNESEETYFHILTGYELRNGQVFPLDDVRQFKTYKGTEETNFLNEIQRAVTSN